MIYVPSVVKNVESEDNWALTEISRVTLSLITRNWHKWAQFIRLGGPSLQRSRGSPADTGEGDERCP